MSVMSTGLGKDERPITRQTYTIDEAAQLLGISRNGAYAAAQRGDIPTITVGKRKFVPRAAFDRFLNGETGQ